MSRAQSPPVVFESPPFFSSQWLGRHPEDHLPRVVACLGPSIHDDHAAGHANVLGLRSAITGKPPTLSKVSAEFDGERLVLYSRGRELTRTAPLPLALATVLQWRAEILLVWVDVPLRHPRTEISLVGLQHVWTGIVPVDGEDAHDDAQLQQFLAAGSWGASSHADKGVAAGVTQTIAGRPRPPSSPTYRQSPARSASSLNVPMLQWSRWWRAAITPV